ncbi:DUF4352 domain-containing protein [Streptomyces sp. NPDC005953]|uniref:DUF4352 domain-containing protein n=1 Tax=Streptomyces sp. NPDC005953 TaxID=3156719 RepID=UPI0033C3D921
MRTARRVATVSAALVIALIGVTGCSSDKNRDASSDLDKRSESAVPPAPVPSTASSSAPPLTPLSVGETGTYEVIETDDAGENPTAVTTMQVTVKGVKYVEPAALGATENATGRYAVLTLTVKNVGQAAGNFSETSTMTWENADTAAQGALVYGLDNDSPDLETTYQPGQSLTGDLHLDVGSTGGIVTYYDNVTPSIQIAMPTS